MVLGKVRSKGRSLKNQIFKLITPAVTTKTHLVSIREAPAMTKLRIYGVKMIHSCGQSVLGPEAGLVGVVKA